MVVRLITAKSALSKSAIPDLAYTVNPYVGCQHGCKYCYADFMRRFTGHRERWGEFVDVRQNIAEQLEKDLRKIESKMTIWDAKERIWMSIVTDPYQPLEKKFKVTRKCLEVLLRYRFPVAIQTRSPLVLRDIDLFKQFDECEVGLSVTTDDDRIREIFEPRAPTIQSRIKTLEKLHAAGVTTFAFIGPMLPMNARKLGELLAPVIDSALIDQMNYAHKTVRLYRHHKLEFALGETYFDATRKVLEDIFRKHRIEIRL